MNARNKITCAFIETCFFKIFIDVPIKNGSTANDKRDINSGNVTQQLQIRLMKKR